MRRLYRTGVRPSRAYPPPVITALKHDGGHVATIDNPDGHRTSLEQGCLIWVDVKRSASKKPIASSRSSRSTTSPSRTSANGGLRTAAPPRERRSRIRAPRVHRRVFRRPLPGQPPHRPSRWVITFRQPNEAGATWSIDPVLVRFQTGRDHVPRKARVVHARRCSSTTASSGPVRSKARIEKIEAPDLRRRTPEAEATPRRSCASSSTSAVSCSRSSTKSSPWRRSPSKLRDGEVKWVGEENAKEFENLRNHVFRANDQLTSQRDLVSSEVDALLALASQRMNEVMKTMTGWGSILLGATLIAGIYGMNFTHMPELSWYFGYPTAIGMMVMLTSCSTTSCASATGSRGSSRPWCRRRRRGACGGPATRRSRTRWRAQRRSRRSPCGRP